MLSRIFFACVFLGLFCACSSLSCRWMDHKFRQYSENALNVLDMMANNGTNSTEDGEQTHEAFPYHLYSQASKASAEGKLSFTVHILREVSALFEEDHSSSSWQEITVEHFLNVVNKQADELHSCAYHHVSQDAEVNTEPFPHHLYNQASRASAEGKLAFTVHILREVSALFEEDHSSSSWQEITVDHFLNVVNKQADELQLCSLKEFLPGLPGIHFPTKSDQQKKSIPQHPTVGCIVVFSHEQQSSTYGLW
ncbi:uncharacterized protein V3H82_000737 [Fundulus diaphanus]